jgi:hydrogenase maturation protease
MSSDGVASGLTVVIGLGSPLMADDGLGLVALTMLREEWRFDEHVELVDGGTWGMSLLPHIEAADRLILLDAIDRDEEPGALVRLDREELPRFLSLKISPHQIDLREVLAVAEIRGKLPKQTVALGLQPERVELSDQLSPMVEDRIPDVVAHACRQLEAWGHEVRRLTEGVQDKRSRKVMKEEAHA